MCGSRPQLGLTSKVGIGLDCLPNHELSLLCGRITLDRFPVGREVELVQGNVHFAFLHLAVSVSSPALSLQVGVLSPSSLSPPEVDPFRIRVGDVHGQFAFGPLGLLPRHLSDGKRMGRQSCGL